MQTPNAAPRLFFARSSSPWIAAALLLASLLPLGGCTPYEVDENLDAKSGVDKTREGAQEIPLNATAVDNVDLKRLDKTDWKYFTVPSAGVVEIVVSFDNPRAFGEMVVTDEVGQIVSTFQDEKRRLLDRVTFKAESGLYYLQLWANAEGSDYSVQVNFSAL